MKRILKLTWATALLAGSLTLGAPLEAAELCEDYCCDPSCTRIVHCEAFGTWCVCNWGCPGYEQIDP